MSVETVARDYFILLSGIPRDFGISRDAAAAIVARAAKFMEESPSETTVEGG